jgi:hypothetical protein
VRKRPDAAIPIDGNGDGNGDGADGNGNGPPGVSFSEGEVAREQSAQQAYVIYGGAKFLIPSAAELGALGFDPAAVRVVPDGALASVGTIPLDGTVLRDRLGPEVYVAYSGKLFHIPTPDALFAMGLNWSRVRVVPSGSLASLPKVGTDSGSPPGTPGSLVYPPTPPRHQPLTGVSGSTRVLSQGQELRIIELRGWLYPVPPDFEINAEGEWDDWHYWLEVDPGWTDRLGLDLSRLLPIGNILEHGLHKASEPPWRLAGVPRIHVEINGWKPNNTRGVPRPADWTATAPASRGLPDTRWPFNPLLMDASTTPLMEHQVPYVRVVGSLISDTAHASTIWGGTEPTSPARHIELHPPDRIEVLPYEPHRETVWTVAVAASQGLISSETEIVVSIAPPSARPSPTSTCGVRELVGPETILPSITLGNAGTTGNTGAELTVSQTNVQIRVKVRGNAFWGGNGRFKAIYRVFWN